MEKLKVFAFVVLCVILWHGALIAPAFGQQNITEVNVQPIVSTSTQDSVNGASGASILWRADPWVGADTGYVLYGAGIQAGTTITGVNAALDTVWISDTLTAALSVATINFGLFSSTAYGSGDWLGYPFTVFTNKQAGITTLISAQITDGADVLTDTDIMFFSAYVNDAGLDNAVLALPAAKAYTVLGYVALATAKDVGAVKMLTKDDINLAIPTGTTIYARLISRGTPTYTAINNIRVRLRFK